MPLDGDDREGTITTTWEVTMSTTTIARRPSSLIATGVVAAVIAFGSLAVVVSQHDGRPAAPAEQVQKVAQPSAPQHHHSVATTSGGRVMIGP